MDFSPVLLKNVMLLKLHIIIKLRSQVQYLVSLNECNFLNHLVTSSLIEILLHYVYVQTDFDISKDPEMIRQSAMESTVNFPEEVVEMIKKCDIGSLILTRLRYHAPWNILFGRFSTDTVTVAGDAMHVMAPFLGQGGSAAIEDAIVLARCLTEHLKSNKVQAPLKTYVKQRRMRLVKLSTQTYLTGMLLEPSSAIVHYLCLVLLLALFHDILGHTRYYCGPL